MTLGKLLFLGMAAIGGAVSAGTLHVEIHEYDLPTAKSRPHDPAGGAQFCKTGKAGSAIS